MSLRYEQYNSLKRTREFLRSLLNLKMRPRRVQEIREQAYRCLHHFPPLHESGQPLWSLDDFTADVPHRLPGTSRVKDTNGTVAVDYSRIVSSFPPVEKDRKKCRR
jgi:hypothetical protein